MVIVRLSAESSTRRMRSARQRQLGARADRHGARRVAPAQISSGTAKENTLPLPTPLSTEMRPPISSTSRFEIVSPRPEPPYLRVVDESACVNRSNTAPNFSPGMPMPVSEIVNRTTPEAESASGVTRSATSPDSVNLIALPSRLSSTCRSRVGSPTRSRGTSGAISHTRARPFLVGSDRHHLGHLPQQIVQREPGPLQLELRGFDLGQIEDVVDEMQQVVAGAAKDLHVLVLLGGERGLREQIRDADDRIHRRSDLVAHARQKIGLGLARGLRHGLGLLQLRLHPLALRDVARRGEDALQRAAPVVEGGRVVGHHRLLPVARARRQLVVGDLPFAQHALDSPPRPAPDR